ncbi:uncharacterized protein LOC115880093 [Sitophilus oryzae]|uniref:Uncharacterized protein LOC115880093 n=1 Tax=Sitophilus oryzae TaxID=7048 RepID=A0A6J2XQZ9_SITOR|nr:uncharacterized protein LOC115880093 [Sitophilus oryzae]
MSRSLKIFLRIIHRRLYGRCEDAMSDTQFRFRQGLGNREALAATKILVQNCYDQRKNACLCFIDYEKAFDSVQHHKLMQLLRRLDLDQKDIRCIENLYSHQSARVKFIERVEKFKYLGAWLHEDWSSNRDIKYRIEEARGAFLKFKKVFTCSDFDLELRLRFVECYVWSVLLYGVESWTLKASAINRLEAFEMWIYRRILKIPWTAKIRNEDVLRRINRVHVLSSIL